MAEKILLGIEGGGTRTTALFLDTQGSVRERRELGPGNLRLLTEAGLAALFRNIARGSPRPAAVGIGLAGVRTEGDRQLVRQTAAQIWPGIPCLATNDLEIALAAVDGPVPASRKVLILSGTGSCCFGQAGGEAGIKVGGWGHLLGDRGSGYDIGISGLRSVIDFFDHQRQWPALGATLLRMLLLNQPEDLIAWVQTASKAEIAALAPGIFSAWSAGDRLARSIIQAAAGRLAADAMACAGHLCARQKRPVLFVSAGAVLLKQPAFDQLVQRQIRKAWPGARFLRLEKEGAWGAAVLAETLLGNGQGPTPAREAPPVPGGSPKAAAVTPGLGLTQSPTEQRNPRSLRLDRMSIASAVELMLSEDASITTSIGREKRKIVRAIGWIARAFKQGGRLFYAGAGTSGRLGVLDASECPPTFGSDPDLVQGIMAGGFQALWNSIEGAEDDADGGSQAIRSRRVRAGDVVVGIAASGRTPFVWGALREAARLGARTVLLAFNPSLLLPRDFRPDLVIAPNLGPEVLTGSTRLKAGTATKLILNMFTTLAMVRTGKVISNLMIDLRPTNVKLQDRAARIVLQLAGCDYEQARRALEQNDWNIKQALRSIRR
jgi:N-acetylmuramic acid 6-phosphate etherase